MNAEIVAAAKGNSEEVARLRRLEGHTQSSSSSSSSSSRSQSRSDAKDVTPAEGGEVSE